MRQYDTLGETIEKVRHEAGQSAHAGHGSHDRSKVVHLINRVQLQLATEHDWPDRRSRTTLRTVRGQHTYPLPAQFSFERVHQITHERNQAAAILDYGIHPDMLAYADPEEPASYSAHPRVWEYVLRDGADQDQIQIWPTPDQELTLRITGSGELMLARSDGARLAFPGDIVALYVAAELLAEQGDELAASKRLMAERLTRHMLGRQTNKGQVWGLGRAYSRTRKLRYGRDYVD